MKNNNKTITVFTPAYNRAHTLERTYHSLVSQTCHDFIWLIIDDGSKDHTKELVAEWMKQDNPFEIQYCFKENGGMHTAHNRAYSLIRTELNVCVDSDDCMPPNAIRAICDFWKNHGSEDVAGIVALDGDMDGRVIGSGLPAHVSRATTTQLYEQYGVTGDKKFIYRTDVITSVPTYPEFAGEKLVPLGYKYALVADQYPMLLMNEVVCNVDYQPDGSSNTIYRQYLQSPRGFAADKIIRMTRTKKTINRLKCIVHYIAECRIAGDGDWLKNSPLKISTVLLYPLGILFEHHIRRINRPS